MSTERDMHDVALEDGPVCSSHDDDGRILIHDSIPEPMDNVQALQEEETNMETILEQSAASYVVLSATSQLDSPTSEYGETILEAADDDSECDEVDYVFLSTQQAEPQHSTWTDSLYWYAQHAAEKASLYGGSAYHAVRSGAEHVLSSRRPSNATIHDSYDWVSDTQIEGGRLILPGQLISWDETASIDLSDPDGDGDVLQNLPSQRGHRLKKSTTSTSTIMVSAHDLLAVQSLRGGQINPWEDSMDPSYSSAGSSVLRKSFAGVLGVKIRTTTRRWSTKAQEATRMSLAVSIDKAKRLLVHLDNQTGFLSGSTGWVYNTLQVYRPRTTAENARGDNDFECPDNNTGPSFDSSQAQESHVASTGISIELSAHAKPMNSSECSP